MKCDSNTKWKYLRESDVKFFNPSKNTTLKDYLESIFSDSKRDWQYQSSISKTELPDGILPKRYVCDAINRHLKLVVEFDGLNHYMDTQVCLNDISRDIWFQNLGYKVVRIPYWIQLSRDVIEILFELQLSTEEQFCVLDHSFYDPEHSTVDYNILPGNMCELGRKRFVKEFNMFNANTRKQILKDLMKCAEISPNDLLTTVIPSNVYKQLNLNFLWDEDLHIEHLNWPIDHEIILEAARTYLDF